MSTDQDGTSLFTKVPATTTIDPVIVKTTTTQPNMDEVFSEHLAGIKNEDGGQKYSDVITALAALKHTQEHVKTLEDENTRFRTESVKAKTMDEVLQQIATTKTTTEGLTSSPELDVEKVRNATFGAMEEYRAQQVAATNRTKVETALLEKFKDTDKAKEAFVSKAGELGLSVSTLDELAATSPKAVLEYFNMSKDSSPKPIEGTVNTDALGNFVAPTKVTKNIMYGASTADILESWRAAGATVEK